MAEAVFSGHPLEEYLHEAGDLPAVMPGEHADDDESDVDRVKVWFLGLVEALASHRPSAFAERFKYDVISSSLLNPPSTFSASSASPLHQRSFTPPIPGRHSREPSVALAHTGDVPKPGGSAPYAISGTILVLALACFVEGSTLTAWLLVCCSFVSAAFTLTISSLERGPSPATTNTTFEALAELSSSSANWDAAIHSAFARLSSPSASPLSHSPSASSSAPIRAALRSALHDTQAQCERLRALLAALVSARDAAVADMYAPPPAQEPALALSLEHRRRTVSLGHDKRATWSGASPGGMKRRDKRRSDLSALLDSPTHTPRQSLGHGLPPSRQALGLGLQRQPSMSAPPTPGSGTGAQLDDVQEEAHGSEEEHQAQFGVAALRMRRQRRSDGLDALASNAHTFTLRSPSPSSSISRTSTPALSPSSHSLHSSISHSLATPVLSALLSSALSARRHACAHLLALRFDEREGEYWEDVVSVMGLMRGVLEGTAARVWDAVQEGEAERDGSVSPPVREPHLGLGMSQSIGTAAGMDEPVGFAPMPNHLARFAAHVEAISGALQRAKEDLGECVSALREAPLASASAEAHQGDQEQGGAALAAYERLRRELGLALRECERGREFVLPRTPQRPDDQEHEPELDDVPALSHDHGSDESDRPDPPEPEMLGFSVVGPDADEHKQDADAEHLPPPGVEQVFEADPDASAAFTRERSKLSRAERIALAKAARDAPPVPRRRETWGPGGEVVQELKDVIWQVGEKRRRTALRVSLPGAEAVAVAPVVPVQSEDGGDAPVDDARAIASL